VSMPQLQVTGALLAQDSCSFRHRVLQYQSSRVFVWALDYQLHSNLLVFVNVGW